MILFKILQEFLLPSTFIFVLILIGFYFWRFKKKSGTIIIIVSILLYYILSITPIADLILSPLESQHQLIKSSELDKADKIVLLLGKGEANTLRASEVIRISNIKSQKVRIIISGTSALKTESNISKDIKRYLIGQGIPSENTILDNQSRNTFESAKNIKEMMGQEPFFLVTSAYHMPRSIEAFQKMGTNPIPAPTDFKTEKDYNILDFFPKSNNLQKSDLAFHEYFGILFYRLRY